MQLGRNGRNPGWAILGLVAIIYGVGVALIGYVAGDAVAQAWLRWGAAVMGVLFIALMVVPYVVWSRRRSAGEVTVRERV